MREMLQFFLLFFRLFSFYFTNKSWSKIGVPVESRPVKSSTYLNFITDRYARNKISFLRAPCYPSIKIAVCKGLQGASSPLCLLEPKVIIL